MPQCTLATPTFTCHVFPDHLHLVSCALLSPQACWLQVRCYLGDNEQRWYMWYSGNNTAGRPIDAVTPSSGSTGVNNSHLHPEHTSVVHVGHLQLCTLAKLDTPLMHMFMEHNAWYLIAFALVFD